MLSRAKMTEKLRWLITFTFNYTHFQRLQKVTQMTRRRHSPLYLSGHVSGQASDLVTTLRKLSASGSFAPWPQQGLCPWTRWGHSPQTPMHSPRCLFHPQSLGDCNTADDSDIVRIGDSLIPALSPNELWASIWPDIDCTCWGAICLR